MGARLQREGVGETVDGKSCLLVNGDAGGVWMDDFLMGAMGGRSMGKNEFLVGKVGSCVRMGGVLSGVTVATGVFLALVADPKGCSCDSVLPSSSLSCAL